MHFAESPTGVKFRALAIHKPLEAIWQKSLVLNSHQRKFGGFVGNVILSFEVQSSKFLEITNIFMLKYEQTI